MDNRAIGIFDSGVGGLTVVKEVVKLLPFEEIVYFGDTARVPYGSKSKETVTKFSKQIVNFLLTKNVKIIIIACGTVSSNSFDELSQAYDIPLIEVVSAGVDACLKTTQNNRVGIIGTERTIASEAYERLIHAKRPEASVYSKACPLFVPLAEEGWTHNDVAKSTAEIYLRELLKSDIDTLVLGCTHYPLLYDCISNVAKGIQIVDPAQACAQRLKEQLASDGKETDRHLKPTHTYFVSDNTSKFDNIYEILLGRDNNDKVNQPTAVKVDIEKF